MEASKVAQKFMEMNFFKYRKKIHHLHECGLCMHLIKGASREREKFEKVSPVEIN
jgi:ribosomal protein L34E